MNPTLKRLTRLGALLGLLPAASALLAQPAPAIFVTLGGTQVAANTTPTAAGTITITAPGSGWAYSAAAPVAGTTWNVIQKPNPSIPIGNNGTNTLGLKVFNSANNIALTSASGTPAVAYLTTTLDVLSLDSNATRAEPNTGNGGNTALGPSALMNDAWRIYNGGNALIHTVTGLAPGQRYFVYFYGSANAAGDAARFTLNAANVPGGNGTATTYIETQGANPGNVFVLNGSNYATTTPAIANVASNASTPTTWGRLDSVVDASGAISFRTSKHPSGRNYSNGFQLMPYPVPTITLQPMPSASATIGDGVTLTVAATGEGTLSYQWRKNGTPIADGATGTGSAYSGVTTASLTISGVSSADDGSYDVVVTNPGGSTPSNATAFTVTAGAIAPSIVASPTGAKASVNGAAGFSVSANGTSPLSYRWEKSTDNVNFTAIDGQVASTLSITPVATADAGYYRVVVTNSVGSATSASASLTVAPVITDAPDAAIVAAGSPASISVVADAGVGSPEPITYVWKRDGATTANGGVFSGATTATLGVSAFAAGQSGVYTVTVSNSAGSATSAPVYVGVATNQSVTLSPAVGSSAINPDAPLVVRFTDVPRVGATGKIIVRRSSDDAIVETIDIAALSVATNGSATYRYQNKTIGGSGGGAYNYLPVVIVGNEARIGLKSGTVLAYGVSYYVTVEPGAILDSTGASLAPISGNAAWTFTTKAAAPAAVPGQTAFTVAADGSGDFSTVQGALDHIPANNTTPVRINIKAGVYDGIVNTGVRHNLTLVGEGADKTIIQALNNNVLNAGTSGRVGFLAKGNDLVFRDLSINNATPKGGSQAEALRSDGSRVAFVGCAFRSYQDTLLLGGTSYFLDCLIAGDTDYIWGGGTALFKNCELLCLNPADLTQARTAANRFGFVFLDCIITKPAGSGISYGLGRNSTDSNVAFIDTRMDTHISATAWSSAFGTVMRNWEYNSKNLAGTALIDVSQRVLSRQLTASEATILRNPANVYGTTSDGTPAGALGDGWVPAVDPSPLPVIDTPPQSRSVAAGQSVTFTVSASGSAAFTYQWRKGGDPILGQVGASLTLSSVAYAAAGSYDVVVTNATGSTTSSAATLAVLSPVAAWADGFGLDGAAPGFASADADGDGVANLLEYVLGGDPSEADSAALAPLVTVVDDAGSKYLVVEYVRATAASSVSVAIESTADFASWTTRTDGVNAEIEVIPFLGKGYNVDVNNSTSAADNYSGLAAAPGSGIAWNAFHSSAATKTNILDAAGEASDVDFTITSSGGFSQWVNTTSGTPNPLKLMQDYLFGATYTVSLGSLPQGSYLLYVYAHGDNDSQTSTVTLGASNGGGTKSTAANGGAFRDAMASGAEGVAYVKFTATVGSAGTLQFSAGNYLNGFQLVHLADPAHETVRVTIPYTGDRLFVRLRASDE